MAVCLFMCLFEFRHGLVSKMWEEDNETLVFDQLLHLSLVIPVLSLAIPGPSLAIPGPSLLVPSQF